MLSTENLQELNENGITLTKENGIVTINGQSTSANFIDDYFIGSSSAYEEFLPAGRYTVSGITGEALSPNFGILVIIKRLDGSTTTIIQNSENKVFNVNEGDTFRVFIRIPQNLQLSNVVIKPMIVAGTEEKPYEEYGASPSLDFPSEVQVASEQNITINETNITIPLINSAIGQYADTIDRENSVQNKFIQELTLTGSESDWGREDTSVGTRFFKPLKNSIIANATSNESALCSHFKLALEGETYNNIKNLFAIYNVGSTNRIGFGSFTDISTVDEWKAKLKELYEAGTPVKIYYVAETSTPEPLSEEVKQELDKFKLYDGLNNISIDNGTLSFKYNKSLLKVLEEKDEKIDDLQSQIDEIKALLSSSSTASLLLENLANDNESEVS